MAGPIEELQEIFHQPARLAVMTELCAVVEGLSFLELKKRANLTDGNLSRHLKALEEGAAIKIQKSFVGAKPYTHVTVTKRGREAFLHYLEALETVLEKAKQVKKPVKAEMLPAGLLAPQKS